MTKTNGYTVNSKTMLNFEPILDTVGDTERGVKFKKQCERCKKYFIMPANKRYCDDCYK